MRKIFYLFLFVLLFSSFVFARVEHCSRNMTNDFSYNISFSKEPLSSSVVDGVTEYYFEKDTVITFSNFSGFVNNCLNSVTLYESHPVELWIKSSKQENFLFGADNSISCMEQGGVCVSNPSVYPYSFCSYGANIVCTAGPSYCSGENSMSFTLSSPGIFDAKLIYPIQPVIHNQDTEYLWRTKDVFRFFVESYDLTILNPASINFKFSDSLEQEKVVFWTIINDNDVDLELENLSISNCDNGLECTFLGLTDSDTSFIIPAHESFIVPAKIIASHPSSSFVSSELILNVIYSAVNSPISTSFEKSSDVSSEFFVSRALFGEEKFNVELSGGLNNFCLRSDGVVGFTGSGNRPKVYYDWAFSSVGFFDAGAEQSDSILFSCDSRMGNAVYCDQTQFLISLFKRFDAANNYFIKQDFVSPSVLFEFDTYLMDSHISSDFLSDFSEFYVSSVFEGAPFFVSDSSPWYLYLDQDKIEFSVNDFDAGLYHVVVNFIPDDSQSEHTFFIDSLPVGSFDVQLSKIRNPSIDFPVYHLPFNGHVGVDSSDGRSDYGIRVSVSDQIVLSSLDNSSYSVFLNDFDSGANSISASYEDSYDYLNRSNRGNVLSFAGNEIVFSPSGFAPIVLDFSSTDGKAFVFYYLKLNDELVLVDEEQYFSLWSSFGGNVSLPSTSPEINSCRTFSGDASFYRMPDYSPPSTICDSDFDLRGFYFDPALSGKNLFETVFYVPFNQEMVLYSVCGTEFSFVNVFSNTSISSPNSSLPLNYFNEGVFSIQSVFDLVDDSKVCVSFDEDSKLDFWWNPTYVSSMFDSYKSGLNPSLICPFAASRPI